MCVVSSCVLHRSCAFKGESVGVRALNRRGCASVHMQHACSARMVHTGARHGSTHVDHLADDVVLGPCGSLHLQQVLGRLVLPLTDELHHSQHQHHMPPMVQTT